MTASILPADGMIAVLSDAIASKRDTIALLERTAKEAQADLQHLREERAVRLARAAGFEVGQVWLVSIRGNAARPVVIYDITPGWGESDSDDWAVIFLHERDRRDSDNTEKVYCVDMPRSCIGRIDAGPVLETFAALARATREQKEKAA